jgi:hypothetical protein
LGSRQRAVALAAKGFSDTARKRAQDAGIELDGVVETGDHDWKSIVELPAIEFTGVTKFSLSFLAVGDEPFEPTVAIDPRTLVLFDQQERVLGTVRTIIRQKWNAGEIPEKPGEYRDVQFTPNPLKFKSRGSFHQASLAANVLVETRLILVIGPFPRCLASTMREPAPRSLGTWSSTTS